MTAILNSRREITLPPEIADAAHLQPGMRFEITVSTSGDIHLRRERPRQRTLLEQCSALQGLEPVRRRDPVPPLPGLIADGRDGGPVVALAGSLNYEEVHFSTRSYK